MNSLDTQKQLHEVKCKIALVRSGILGLYETSKSGGTVNEFETYGMCDQLQQAFDILESLN